MWRKCHTIKHDGGCPAGRREREAGPEGSSGRRTAQRPYVSKVDCLKAAAA